MVVVSTEAGLENVPDPTVIRIHGEVIINVTARTAANDSCVCAMGMILQSSAAISAGVASMPDPATEIDSSWLWHRQVGIRTNVAPPNGTDILGNRMILIDNKSMRKVKPNQGLVLIVRNLVQTGTITFTVVASHRFLLKK